MTFGFRNYIVKSVFYCKLFQSVWCGAAQRSWIVWIRVYLTQLSSDQHIILKSFVLLTVEAYYRASWTVDQKSWRCQWRAGRWMRPCWPSFTTILLHRSTGKFHYKKEGTYSIGTVGIQDVDCDFIDFTFVRVSSDELDRVIRKAVAEFKVLLITLFHLLDIFE